MSLIFFFMIIAQKTEFRACIGELISFFAFVTKIKYIFEPTLTCDSSNMYLLLAILVAIIKEVCFFKFFIIISTMNMPTMF